ncbi:PREDICTED: mediator of RNA polymerase II transcription subunit 15a-like [Lupinus angustifolius]|uniref:mediator of RNA polymerase II transcription subunit 15a-like n=1 Tax=Lupinus angustifolius TaxID=3871 RepID=UPI00092E5C18|nr:PREDICTED: mediator of RNA polymerase II transcription subunit 15a-like [Lupinus angustifolius]
MDTLQKHRPMSGPEGLLELQWIAQRFEENIFTAATSQVHLRMLWATIWHQIKLALTIDLPIKLNWNWWIPKNWMLNQNPEPTMDTSDWRAQLMPDSRHCVVNKIMDTLQKHRPMSGPEGLLELQWIAQRFEENIFTAATSQQDYLRKISLKMLTMEMRPQNAMGNNMPPNQVGPSNRPPHQGLQFIAFIFLYYQGYLLSPWVRN